MTLLLRAALRFYARRPWQFGLALAGIALGVAVYVGVGLATDSARRAFERSSDALVGRATHELLPLDRTLDEGIYREIVLGGRARFAAPVIEGRVRFAALPGERFDLLGIDPLAARPFATQTGTGIRRGAALIAEAGAALLPASIARALGAGVGDTLELAPGQGPRRALEVLAIVGGDEPRAEVTTPIVVDISTAQEVLGLQGALTRIDLILAPAEAAALAAHPPAGTTLVTPTGRDQGFAALTRAFQVNLRALSLLALFVGMFLIYATMAFAIVQRRASFGTVRAIGVGRGMLAAALLAEALVLGSVATLVGVVLGHLLASELVGLVLRTISDLSFRNAVASVPPSLAIYGQGAALGIAATVVGALGPAIDAARTEPRVVMNRAALERRTERRSRLAALAALPALGAAWLLLETGTGLYTAFAALFCVLAAGALVTPLATVGLMRLIEPAARRWLGLAGALAVRGVGASLSRTGVAVAALTVAVATVVGIGTMTQSFRDTFDAWLDVTLRADLYLSSPGADEALDDALAARIETVPGVLGTSRTRVRRLPSARGDLNVRALEPGPRGWGLDLITTDGHDAIQSLAAGNGVMVSEALAFRLGVGSGETLTLPAASGPTTLPIVGVFRDYSTDGGLVLMARSLYRRVWEDDGVSGIGVYLAAGAESARQEIEALLADRPNIRVRANAAIKRISLAIFDRTFRITEVLRVLAGVVAFLGMLSALSAMELERARERAVLRAIGLEVDRLRGLMLVQTTLLGTAAGLLAIPLGTALAALLVYVINERSYGWSMELTLAPGPLGLGLVLAVAAALAAGIVPALRAAASVPAVALRSE